MDIKNAFVFRQAFVNMGYRPMNEKETVWGKPIGFGIVIAEVKGDNDTIEFKTMFTDTDYKSRIWGSSVIDIKKDLNNEEIEGKELYEKCVYCIAYKEFEAKAEKMFFPLNGYNGKTFDFK